MPTTQRFQHIQDSLLKGELHQALATLNSEAPHRFSAVYRLTRCVLHNVALCDKLGQVTPAHLMAVSLEHSFCQFVMKNGGFETSDSARDSRLNGHPYQGVMVSYTGVPLTDSAGEIIGTLCHFDTASHRLSAQEYELLWKVGRVIDPRLLAIQEAV
jgi:hypothetical protein